MLDGKLGEAKQFCMEKLVDFGEAVEAKEMVDVSPCPQRLSDLREGSPESRDGEETRACTIWDTARSTIRSSR